MNDVREAAAQARLKADTKRIAAVSEALNISPVIAITRTVEFDLIPPLDIVSPLDASRKVRLTSVRAAVTRKPQEGRATIDVDGWGQELNDAGLIDLRSRERSYPLPSALAAQMIYLAEARVW